MNKWELIHSYRRAWNDNKVGWIQCPDCEIPLRVVVDKDDDPALRCDGCKARYRPGTEVWSNIKKNLDEIEEA